jgi:hypothetical protein
VAGAVLLANAGLVTAAIALDGSHSLIRFALVAQIFVAAAAGMLAFRSYWQRNTHPDLSEASGMFFWGVFAVVLVVAGVDYGLGVHAAVFGFTAEYVNVFPMLTDPSEQLIVLGYLTIAGPILFMLRHELGATRASATWALVALAGGVVLVASGSFDQLNAMQLYAQAVTGAALTLAFVSRLAEVAAVRDVKGEPAGATVVSWRSRSLVSSEVTAGAPCN